MRRSPKKAARFNLALLAATAMTLGAGPCLAQEDDGALDEIIVTATKQGESDVQATPIALSVIGARELAEGGLTDVQDLVGYAPGLQVSDLSGYTQVYLRGVGSNIVFIGSDPSTTTHLDGVYLARPLSYLTNFLDVERIEVLRGPQGTLYGRNAVGGTLNIVSRRPSETLEGRAQVTVGDFEEYGFAGYASGPIGGGVLGSLAVNRSVHDGFLENVGSAGDLQDEDFWGVRGQLLVPLGESADLTLRLDHTSSESALGQYPKLLLPTGLPLEDGILGDYSRVATDAESRTVARISGAAADLDWRISQALNFRSLTAYRVFDGSIVTDADSSSLPILRTLISPIEQSQFSQEFNLTGRYDRFNFVLGAYLFHEQNREPLTLTVFPAGATHVQRPNLEADSIALFGQGEYFITDRLSVIAGLRWTQDEKNYQLTDYWTASIDQDPTAAAGAPVIGLPFFPDPFTVDARQKSEAMTPRLGLNYRLNDDILLYLSATRGFKSGGFDYGSNNAADASAGYGPEYLWAYETGVKADWFESRLRTNLSAFYYDYTDLQVQSFRNFAALTQNAATAEIAGAELEITARPMSNLDLFATIAYLDAHYEDYEGAFTNGLGTFSADGQTLNNAPEWAYTIGGRYGFDLGESGEVYVGADYRHQSRIFFTAANDGGPVGISGYAQQQAPYGVLNARVGWQSTDAAWDVALIGTNLTDEEYVVGTADYTLVIAGRPGDPRRLRLHVSRSF